MCFCLFACLFLIHCISAIIWPLLKVNLNDLHIQGLQAQPNAMFLSKGILAYGASRACWYSREKNLKGGDSCGSSSFQKNLCKFFKPSNQVVATSTMLIPLLWLPCDWLYFVSSKWKISVVAVLKWLFLCIVDIYFLSMESEIRLHLLLHNTERVKSKIALLTAERF